ncbi:MULTISPECIES: transposase [unclassified Spirillospora]|uniref:IS66 family transposase n=1 Tax=unclassified Spirillospora TaxID=2642701 RepID=UPI003710B118
MTAPRTYSGPSPAWAVQATRSRASDLEKDHNAQARRLLCHDDHLRFTVDARVPFDDNPAKREVRMIKIGRRSQAVLRALAGAEQFCTGHQVKKSNSPLRTPARKACHSARV